MYISEAKRLGVQPIPFLPSENNDIYYLFLDDVLISKGTFEEVSLLIKNMLGKYQPELISENRISLAKQVNWSLGVIIK